jgi:hypothetical protein
LKALPLACYEWAGRIPPPPSLLAPGNICRLGQINPSKDNILFVEGAMIDALLNVAVFATLGLCIIGFGAWARKRVP